MKASQSGPVRPLSEEERAKVKAALVAINAHARVCEACVQTNGRGCNQGIALTQAWVEAIGGPGGAGHFMDVIEGAMSETIRAAERAALEKVVGEMGKHIKNALAAAGVEGVGFCLLLYDFGDAGALAYASDGDRGDVLKLLKEAHTKLSTATQ